ncbi:MAG: sigma-70 family RNA polymerase sigma factor [Nitrospira sp.]|nr:sigma-70 family RNA polymerase sigma factor [Nitrospira sp.]MCA9500327.1 sigma-70 family RNA polymerase sigma factor [Nitrospira sp.]
MTSKKGTSKVASLSGRSTLDKILRIALIQNRKAFLQFLNRRVRSMEIAEEILQQFCMRALSKGGDLKKPESVVAWLYRVLNSTLADFHRCQAKNRQGEAEYARLQLLHSQEFDVDLATVCTCFYKLIPTLKPEYSDILRRIDLDGRSQATVASELGITPNLVRVRLHRARRAIKRVLLMSCCKSCHDSGFMNCECGHMEQRGGGTCIHQVNCNVPRQIPS